YLFDENSFLLFRPSYCHRNRHYRHENIPDILILSSAKGSGYTDSHIPEHPVDLMHGNRDSHPERNFFR
ncbi:MAG: hypothetical protein LUQ69_02480, partial [Methanoregulaceae archaeon]|nr:hypothetical protein [Methanoregulaceae archaeon]